jgi:predicted alpha/beta hydrolase family esterase
LLSISIFLKASALALRKIEMLSKSIKATFLVACFMEKLGNDEIDEINSSFYEGFIDWKKISSNCRNFFMYNSDNDPYVSIEIGERVAKSLGVKMTLVKGAGHFNEKAGYMKFPKLLEDIKAVI